MALYTSGLAEADSKFSLALVALSAASAVALLIFGGNGFAALVGILSGVLTVATIAAVALGVVDQGEANVKAVTGAVCVYVLIGILFVFLYGVIATLGAGDFFAQGTDGTRSLRLYFSFVTLAHTRATATTRRQASSGGRCPSSRRCSASSTS